MGAKNCAAVGVVEGPVYVVERRKPGSLRVVDRALPALFDRPLTAFLRASVRDLLFDGVVVNCTSREFTPAAVCSALRAQPASLHKVDEDVFKFSFFGLRNGCTVDAGRWMVMRGGRDHRDVGRVALYRQRVWDGEPCDSTVFHALRDPADPLASFSPDLCRSLEAKYQRSTEYQGLEAYRYTASLGDMSSNPEEECFCPTLDTCLKKGALDLTECTDSPIVVTLPHFYDADSSYLDTVDGLTPNEQRHEIFIILEPITGTPLSARKRLQFNIHVHPVKKVEELASNLPYAMLPIMWVEEGVDLDGQWVEELNSVLFRPIFVASVSRWLTLSLGVFFIVAAIGMRYMVNNNSVVTQYLDRPSEVDSRKRRSPAQVMHLGSPKF